MPVLRRRISIEQGAVLVAGRPVTERERDGLWAVLGFEVYRLLTDLSGWTDEQYETWVAELLLRILDPAAGTESGNVINQRGEA